jgi:peptidylprolyl isomerase
MTGKTYTEELRQQYADAINQERTAQQILANRDRNFGVLTSDFPESWRAKYMAAFEAFREAVGKMQQVFLKHQVAWTQEGDRARLEEYSQRLNEAQAQLDAWRKVTADVFTFNPQAAENLSEMMIEMIERDVDRDIYEGLVPIAQALIDHQADRPTDLLEAIGYVGYANNDHDLAERAWNRWKEIQAVPAGIELALEKMDEQRVKWKEELARRDADNKRNDNPQVAILTSKGRIVVELFEDEAPQAVASFIFLVEQGFYDRKMFFRVVERFAAQTGCERGDGTGNAGYTIRGEMANPNHRNIFRGSMVMLSGVDQETNIPNPDSASSQFLFSMLPQPLFDGQMTVFGRIIEGMPVLGALQRVDFSKEEERKDKSKRADIIVEASVIRKRDHAYVPEIVSGRLP